MSKVEQRTRDLVIKSLVGSGLSKKEAAGYESGLYRVSSTITEYTQLVYEKLGELKLCKSNQEREALLKDSKNGWESKTYAEEKRRYETGIIQSNMKVKAIKGVYKCNKLLKNGQKCNSDEFYVDNQQRSAGDEGMTTVRQCSKCGARGTEK